MCESGGRVTFGAAVYDTSHLVAALPYEPEKSLADHVAYADAVSHLVAAFPYEPEKTLAEQCVKVEAELRSVLSSVSRPIS
jgi:hypothetical protein